MNAHTLRLKRSHIKRENSRHLSILSRRFLLASKKKHSPAYAKGSGKFFLPQSNRQQRVTVKVAFAKNVKGRSWAAHGKYLQRTGSQRHDEKGQGFDHSDTPVDMARLLNDWQCDDTEHFFKFIISPEFTEKVSLPSFTKTLLKQIEKDLKTRLEWAAVDHYNTDHPHVHVLIRGRDDQGKTLVIDPTYLSEGIRQHAQQLLTNHLGLRTESDMTRSRSRQIDKNYLTSLDRTILQKVENNVVSYENRIPHRSSLQEKRLQEIARLKYLETLGLAKKVGRKKWQLSCDLVPTLHEMQLSNDIIKSCAEHRLGYQGFSDLMQPSVITTNQPLKGRVIGMGLHQELHDKRYLLLAGHDNKIHYVEVGNSIVKSRDQGAFKNGDEVMIESRHFKDKEGECISYLKITKAALGKTKNNKRSWSLER